MFMVSTMLMASTMTATMVALMVITITIVRLLRIATMLLVSAVTYQASCEVCDEYDE